jgi:glucose/arabinose dehydrogenase
LTPRTVRSGPRRPARRRAALVAAFALVLGVLAGPAPAGAAARPAGATAPRTTSAYNPSAVNLNLTQLPGSFSQPVLVTHAGDGSGRLFVVEKTGRIKVIASNGTILATPMLDISAFVSKGSEQGLLGLAFHPEFETNGKLYVNYTTTAGHTAINEYRVTTDPNRASGARRILTISQPYSNHNGGHLAFGPDGYLYIGMGDGGSAGDPGNRAQSLNYLLGKMLRIDINGTSSGKQYRIPSTNPYVGRTGLDEIWARGLRNPWRWSFDRQAKGLWIADVGQNRYEEVNRATYTQGLGRAANYGWRVMEGRHCYSPSSGCSTTGKVKPLVEYAHAVSGTDNCSVTGGYVYRGADYPILQGGYLFADFCSGRIWTISASAAYPAAPVLLEDTALTISSFGEDEDGELYLTDLNGRVYAISAVPK